MWCWLGLVAGTVLAATAPPTAPSIQLDEVRVREAIAEMLDAQRGGTTIALKVLELPKQIELPMDDYHVSATPPSLGLRAGVQRIPIVVEFADGKQRKLLVTATLQINGPILVPVRDLQRGERLSPGDLRHEQRQYPEGAPLLSKLPRSAVARKPIKSGEPLTQLSVATAAAVEPGMKVKARLISAEVEIELDTVAKSRGEIGSWVTVAGVDGRPVRARVLEPGVVAIEPDQPEQP
jgi:flagella basal body P-ring formation protein FlgA